MRKKNNYYTALLLIIIIVLSIFLIKDRKKEQVPEYTSEAIMEKISFIQELSLVKYNYSGVINYKEKGREILNIEVPYSKKSFLIRYYGYVRAGIDMNEARVEVNGNLVRVHLPKPKVQETVVDEKTMVIYDEKMEIFSEKQSLKDYQKAIVGEKNRITRDAVQKGILTESSDQAHKFIRNFLSELGFETIIIDENTGIEMPDRMIDK